MRCEEKLLREREELSDEDSTNSSTNACASQPVLWSSAALRATSTTSLTKPHLSMMFSKESLGLLLKNDNTLQRVPNANLNIDQKSDEQQPQNHQTYTNADRDRKQRTSTGDRETVYEHRALQYNFLEFVPDTIPILLLTSTKINTNKCARTAPETYQKSCPNLSKIDPKRYQN